MYTHPFINAHNNAPNTIETKNFFIILSFYYYYINKALS